MLLFCQKVPRCNLFWLHASHITDHHGYPCPLLGSPLVYTVLHHRTRDYAMVDFLGQGTKRVSGGKGGCTHYHARP